MPGHSGRHVTVRQSGLAKYFAIPNPCLNVFKAKPEPKRQDKACALKKASLRKQTIGKLMKNHATKIRKIVSVPSERPF